MDSGKNLGVIIDGMLTFEEQVQILVKSIEIRKLSKVKTYPPQSNYKSWYHLKCSQNWTVIVCITAYRDAS